MLLLAGAIAFAGWARVAVAALAFFLVAGACSQRALNGLSHTAIDAAARAGEYVTVRGTVAADPEGPAFTTGVIVRVDAFEPDGGAGRAAPGTAVALHRLVLVRSSGTEAGGFRLLTLGDRVAVTGRVEPLDGYDRRFRWRHVVARVVDPQLVGFSPSRSTVLVAANAVRSATQRGATGLAPNERALFAGFLLGDTRGIASPVVADYRNAGLSHLLAVSGANVAFVLALAGPLLRRCRLPVRLTAGIAIIVIFAAATRFEPSVLRASVMAAIAMAASFAGRPVAPVRLLAYAVIALLLADPFLLHSVGFLLSVGASAGIALWSAPIARRLPGPRVVRETLAVTIAAQLGVAPILLPVFGSIPAITPLANLLAVPVAEPLTVYGFATAFLLALVAPIRPLAAAVQLPTRAMLSWVSGVAHVSAAVPLALHTRAALGLLALACTAAAAWKAGATLRGDAGSPFATVDGRRAEAAPETIPEAATR